MKNHTQESLEEARMQGVWDREDRKPIQDHYGNDGELNDAYLAGYDPKGEIVPFKKFCPNCADQASIAAPGETVLCKTHSDEKHYADMKEFFDSQISNLEIQGHKPFCSRCGKDRAEYIGFIQGAITLTSFSFCIDCRNELALKKNAAIAAQEKIGA